MPPPDRWDAYCPVGKVIPRTKFIAFKVPLKESLLQNVSKEDQLSPEILIQTLQEQGIKLGMVIDLTFTYKYYNIQDFEKQSVLHRKIFVKGHQVPDDSNFQEFAEAVKGFDKEDHVIGVHCTHGVNRTGYLICRYLIEEMDFEPEEAIAMFNEARGHGIERENYLADLSQRKK
ncbi:RNA/RNP complex-1-interacting phosphatase isoform X2 [Aplysia californica]|nr:RNA/RNP complex-1-interacting phosphatase isoform X2 [Aplysia californica]